MNKLLIKPVEIELLSLDGIEFENNTFIEFEIDGEPHLSQKAFEDGTVYWAELKSSAKGSGRYLIFTCACGVADDAGWELINVTHSVSEVSWQFERNGVQRYVFKKSDYIAQIEKCEIEMNLNIFPLAVEDVSFPESENT